MPFLSRIAAGLAATCCLALPADAATPEIGFEKYRLPNGLDVILHVDHTVPIVHVEVWYRVGSKDEAPGKTGFAHLFEHLMFKGTKHIPEDSYFKYLGQAGASARNGSTSTDRTNYFETLPANQLELGLWLESSRMGFLLDRVGSFRAAFQNERDVVKNERRQRIENAPFGGVAAVELEALFPPGHPYRHEVMGSMKDLDVANEDDVRGFFNRYYAPNNAVLLLAGDLDMARVKGLVEKYFGPIPAGPPVVQKPVVTPSAPPAERRIAMEANVDLPRGLMTWNTVPVFAPGDAEMDLLANVLGGGKSSRLYRRLVYELKIAQSVSVVHISRLLSGTFEIAYVPLQGHTLAELETVIDQELGTLRDRPVEAAELERARNEIRTDMVRGLDTLQGLAGRLLTYDVFAGDPAYFGRDLGRYEAATPEALQKWAAQILPSKARVTIDVEPDRNAPIMGRVVSPTPAPDRPTATPKVDKFAPRQAPDAEFRAKLPAPGVQTQFKVPTVKRFRLRNGLRVILAESHKLPLVGVEMVVRTGNGANPTEKAGLADLVADMLDEGTATRSASRIAEEIAQLGATLQTNATWDASSVSVSSLTENFDRSLAVWSDVLLNPTFTELDLTRVRDNLLSTLARRKDSPPLVAGLTFARVLYGEHHPYGWPLGGTQESVRRITRADVQAFFQKYYRPNNAVLVVAGDIKEAEVRGKMEKLLAAWKPKPVPTVKLAKAPPIDRTHIALVDKPGAPQSSIRVGLVGIERKDPDYYRALVMNQILGGSFKRLGLNLRESKGWTYGVASMFEARRAPGPWTAGGEFVTEHTADSVSEIVKEISALRSDDVTDKELRDTKDEIIRAFPARFATANQVAAQMAALAVYGLPDNELQGFTSKIAAVTAADVRKMAQKHLRPDALVIVVVGDRVRVEASLRKLGNVELRDLDGAIR